MKKKIILNKKSVNKNHFKNNCLKNNFRLKKNIYIYIKIVLFKLKFFFFRKK